MPPGIAATTVAWVYPMEILIWLGISAAVLLLVWAAAPHHARMVENRDVPGVETWD
jgi:ABC-type methionine transport system permease subunit